VIDDLHGLQDGAGAELSVTLAGRQHEQVDDRRFLHRLRDGEVEMAAEVAYRLALDVLDEGGVLRLGDQEVVVREQALRVLRPVQVQPVPVDDRAARQDQAQGLNVVKGELVEALEPVAALGVRRGRGLVAGRRCQWCVVVALPSAGRRSESVPKKMPSVTPSTAS
jgi:hypothetical protein